MAAREHEAPPDSQHLVFAAVTRPKGEAFARRLFREAGLEPHQGLPATARALRPPLPANLGIQAREGGGPEPQLGHAARGPLARAGNARFRYSIRRHSGCARAERASCRPAHRGGSGRGAGAERSPRPQALGQPCCDDVRGSHELNSSHRACSLTKTGVRANCRQPSGSNDGCPFDPSHRRALWPEGGWRRPSPRLS
jgi:hypothetical protein